LAGSPGSSANDRPHALRQNRRREVQRREQFVGLLSAGRIFLPLDGAHDFLGELPRAKQFPRGERLGETDVLQFPNRQPGLPVPLLLVAQILEATIDREPAHVPQQTRRVRRVGIDRAGFARERFHEQAVKEALRPKIFRGDTVARETPRRERVRDGEVDEPDAFLEPNPLHRAIERRHPLAESVERAVGPAQTSVVRAVSVLIRSVNSLRSVSGARNKVIACPSTRGAGENFSIFAMASR